MDEVRREVDIELRRVGTMRQSILARAFAGQLV